MATSEIITYVIRVEDKATKVLDRIDSKFADMGKTAVGVLGEIAQALSKLSIGILNFTVDAGKSFIRFEDSLSHARRTLNLTKEEADALGKELQEMSFWSLESGVALDELGKIAGIAGQLGIAREEVVAFTRVVAMMGTAFGMSVEKAAEGMAILMNVFGLNADKMERLGSAITHLGNTTAATAGQIIQIAQRMGGTAAVFGLTADQVAAIGATLRALGVTVNVAGTSMSQILARIMQNYQQYAESLGLNAERLKNALESKDPSKALFMVLNALNQIYEKHGKLGAMQALKELGLTGVRVQDSMIKLATNVDMLRGNMDSAEKAALANTATQEAYNKSIDRFSKIWESLKNLLDSVKVSIAGPLMEVIGRFLETRVRPALKLFNLWVREGKFFQETWPKILAHFEVALNTVWKWLRSIFDTIWENRDAVAAWVTEGGFQKIVEAVKAIGKAILDIPQHIENLKIKWQEFQKAIEPVALSADAFKTGWAAAITGVQESFKTATPIIESYFWKPLNQAMQSGFEMLISASGPALKSLEDGFKASGDIIVTAINFWWEQFERLIQGIIDLGAKINNIVQSFGGFNTVKDILIAVNIRIDLIVEAFCQLIDIVQQVIQAFGDIPATIDKIQSGIAGMIGKIKEGTKAIIEFGKAAVWGSAFPDMLQSVLDNIETMGDLEKAIQNATDTLKILDDAQIAAGGKMAGNYNEQRTQLHRQIWLLMQMKDQWTAVNEEVQKTTSSVSMFGDTVASTPGLGAGTGGGLFGSGGGGGGGSGLLPPTEGRSITPESRQPRTLQPRQHDGGGGMVQITFQGTNVVDEISLDRFVRQITEVQEEHARRMVRTT